MHIYYTIYMHIDIGPTLQSILSHITSSLDFADGPLMGLISKVVAMAIG